MNNTELLKQELTHENTPKAVNFLINEIAEMRVLLEHMEKQLGLGVNKHKPIGIEDAAIFLGRTVREINKMIRQEAIPHYIQDRKIYFFEDDLIKWIEKGRVKTWSEKHSKITNRYGI